MRIKVIFFLNIIIAVYILNLFWSGSLNLYIHPRYNILTMILTIISLVISIVAIFKFDNEDKIRLNLSAIYIAFFIFLIVLVPTRSLSYLTAEQRINSSFENNSNVSPIDIYLKNTDHFSFADWIRNVSTENMESYIDTNATLQGFISNLSKQEDGQYFMITRFMITCCAVDASPVGFFAISDELMNEYSNLLDKTNTWIDATGKLELRKIGDGQKLVLVISKYSFIEKPNPEYIF